MSADNGIYILTTRRERNKKEYRVIHAQAIENVQDAPDYPSHSPLLNRDEVLRYFGNARVFTDRKIAEGYAIRWLESRDEQGWITEYGIRWLEYPHVRFPYEGPYGDAESEEYIERLDWELDWANRHSSCGCPIPSSRQYMSR